MSETVLLVGMSGTWFASLAWAMRYFVGRFDAADARLQVLSIRMAVIESHFSI
jgi:hypothetical protein